MTLAAQQTAARVIAARRIKIATTRRRVPVTTRPKLIESDYAGRVVAIVDRIRAATQVLLDDLPAILRVDSAALRTDDGKRARKTMERVRAELDTALNPTAFEGVAEDFGRRVSAHQRADLVRQGRAALGVDVVLFDPKIAHLIDGFVHENVSRITSIQGRALDDIEGIVTRAVANGTRADAVAAEIRDRFGVTERRARLLAKDQIGKLHSQITEARHAEIGIKSYKWVSLLVGNRRPEHVARHGKTFRYDKPPADGHPGRAICCRCLQQPLFDNIYAELDALGV